MKSRAFQPSDLGRIFEMNQAEVPHLGSLTRESLQELVTHTCQFRVLADERAGEIGGFIVVMDERSAYQSPNYLWFKARYPHFTYVDRIAIAPAHQGKGLGRRLYDELEASVRDQSPLIACEVNLRPPNPDSIDFHRRIGFREVGQQDTEGGKKTVAMMVREISR